MKFSINLLQIITNSGFVKIILPSRFKCKKKKSSNKLWYTIFQNRGIISKNPMVNHVSLCRKFQPKLVIHKHYSCTNLHLTLLYLTY